MRTRLALLLTGLCILAPAAALARRDPPERGLHLLVDSPYQLWNAAGTKVHLVAFTELFRPAAGAEVLLDGKRIGRTDANGTFIFDFRGHSTSRGELIVRLGSGPARREGEIGFEAYSRTPSFGKVRVYLYTDRLTYRPGETLHARVIAWSLKDAYRPARGQTARLVLSAGGREVASREMQLDEFGTAHADFDLRGLQPVAHVRAPRPARGSIHVAGSDLAPGAAPGRVRSRGRHRSGAEHHHGDSAARRRARPAAEDGRGR